MALGVVVLAVVTFRQLEDVLPFARAVCFALALMVARDRPGWALAATVLLQLPWPGPGGAPPPWMVDTHLCQAAILLVAASALRPRSTAVLGGLMALAATLRTVVSLGPGLWAGPWWSLAVLWVVSMLLVVAVGIRRRDRWSALVRRQQELRTRALRTERDRIGRELHDVVAHHLSVLAVRSASATRRIPDVPDAAAVEFDELAALSRSALADMRRLVGVLRDDDPDDDPHRAGNAPQPGLSDLPALVEVTRGAGCPVALDVDGGDRVPDVVAVSVHRIVREALANAVRHATGAAIGVRVTATPGGPVFVEVTNDRPPEPPVPAPGAGTGLRAMAERARLLGGTLESGPTDDGGFVVRARLPWGTT
ncbi:sensor histidine kinase [Pseudonocardia alni]|uniref:sensor histidine kinase n=1 Tax=Pseudonocardia alni TaxID=33907 RepID=UPI0033E4927C